MLYLVAILASLLIGLLTGGSFAAIAKFSFRLVWVLAFALMLRLTLLLAGGPDNGWPDWLNVSVNLISYVLVVGVALANVRPVGMKILVSGVLLNLLAIALNGGYMPVDAGRAKLFGTPELIALLESGQVPTHRLNDGGMTGYLGDWLSIPWMKSSLFSPGDVIISIGLFVLVQQLMRWGMSPYSRPKDLTLRLPPLKSME